MIPYIESELECKKLCLINSTCTFYSYFLANDTLLHQNCFLLTEFLGPAQPCSTCITGPRDCSVGCSLALDGEEHQGVMVTSPGQDTEVAVTGWGECALTLLVVGGGGAGYYGGGGSAYMEYRSLQVSPGTRA